MFRGHRALINPTVPWSHVSCRLHTDPSGANIGVYHVITISLPNVWSILCTHNMTAKCLVNTVYRYSQRHCQISGLNCIIAYMCIPLDQCNLNSATCIQITYHARTILCIKCDGFVCKIMLTLYSTALLLLLNCQNG